MNYFYDTFMGHRRDQWLRSIHAIEVQSGGNWHRGAINKKLVEGNTLVIYATLKPFSRRLKIFTSPTFPSCSSTSASTV